MTAPKCIIKFEDKTGRFIFDADISMYGQMRMIPFRKFLNKRQVWHAPGVRKVAEYIQKHFKNNPAVEFSERALIKLGECLKTGTEQRLPFPVTYVPKTNPFEHQSRGLDYTWGLNMYALFCEMGTGKSKMFIDNATAHYYHGHINAMLIAVPVPIRYNWLNELAVHCPAEFSAMVVDCSTKTAERAVREFVKPTTDQGKFKVLVVGLESMSQGEAKGKAFDIAFQFVQSHRCKMVVDESHLIKSYKATRAKNCITLGMMCKYRAIGTGTSVTQGPMDLYMQFAFLNPDIIGFPDFFSFRARYAEMGGFQAKQVVGFNNLEELMDAVRPYTYQVTKGEALDLPDKLYTVRHVELTKEQKKLYKAMEKDRLVSLQTKGGELEIEVENILTAHLHMQQIVGGFISHDVDDDLFGRTRRGASPIIPPDKNPKLKEVLSLASEHPGQKIIIWARFRWEIEQIVTQLRKEFGPHSCSEYHGGLTAEEREASMKRFKTNDQTRFFIANQQTGGTGLTINESSLVIYYSNTFKANERWQSEDRNHRIGQTNHVTYIDLVTPGTIDETVQRALAMKQDLADYVKEQLRSGKSLLDI